MGPSLESGTLLVRLHHNSPHNHHENRHRQDPNKTCDDHYDHHDNQHGQDPNKTCDDGIG